ncbi:hypothetical protein [Planococcus maitriensis]|uniref:Uncharacterized protein n=1 Tax=Planococcus maitriensis TaxID=221799 RepID=A0A365K510_9BACL|nr:hypothetical protein [Planococcus maitriensis]RAZ67702.1 hypothetical protein DP119_08610 [Planococcus maitriensis]
MKKKFYIYNILLTNGDMLEDIRIEGALEDHFIGIAVSLLPVEDAAGKTIVLNLFHIVRAELVRIEEA